MDVRGEVSVKTMKRISLDANDVPGGIATVRHVAAPAPEEINVLRRTKPGGQLRTYITFEQSDARLAALLGLLKKHNVDWSELVRDVYSNEELLAARLLMLKPNRECDVDGGPDFGTSYDASQACPRCGTGARQTSPLIVGGEDVPKLQNAVAAQTYYGDILVRENVAAALEDAGISGLDLRRVFESTGSTQRRLPWRQILAERSLPSMSPHTTGIIREYICPLCQRQGYAATPEEPTRIFYREKDLENAQDVNATWEWFGMAVQEPKFPEGFVVRPRLIVSPKVVKILMDHEVTAFGFVPVRVESN
jgi:hypothetical protein